MHDFTASQISVTEEKRIVTGLIVSNEFAKSVFPYISLDYFTSPYLRRVASWCISFYDDHGKAPFKHIKDIYETKSARLKDNEAELIKTLLGTLSDQYDDASTLNVEYLMQTAEEYFRKREIEIHVNNLTVLKDSGDLTGAEDEIARFTRISLAIDDSLYIDPGNQTTRDQLYKKLDSQRSDFFQFPGDLGEFLGPFKPGDVVGITAPKKRGKTIRWDSLIYLADGTCKTIKDVVESKTEHILCMNTNMQLIPGKAIDWIYSGMKDDYELVTKSGQRINCAITHPFFTPDGWKTLGDLKTGDMVSISKNTPVKGKGLLNPYYVKAMAYLIADGHLGREVSFTKHDKYVMDDFKSCVEHFKDTYSPIKDRLAIRVHQGSIHGFLCDCGLLGKLSGDKFIPDTILKSSNKSVSLFLRTLFTCDGSIWKDKNTVNVEYSSKSKILVQQIQMCLHRFGLVAKQRTKYVNGVPYHILLISSNPSVKQFLDCIGFSFHKKEKADGLYHLLTGSKDYIDVIPYKWVKEEGQRLRDIGSGFNDETYRLAFNKGQHAPRAIFERVVGDHPILHTDIMWDYIVAIHKTGKQVPMYDLTVEGTHNFIANSFIVHNSWLLNDFFKHLITSKIRTVKWAIEMTDTEEIERFDKLFIPTVNKKAGYYRYPVFDCMKNQMGDCGDRLSKVVIRDDPKKPFIENDDHVVCTKCRYTDPQRFVPTSYNEMIWRESTDGHYIMNEMEQHCSMLSKYSRIIARPKYTLSYDLMMHDLDRIYQKWGFIPRALLLDYVDILEIASKFDDYRLEDEKWKLMQKLASATRSLVITPTQSNKEGELSTTMKSTDQGGFYGKGRHVNIMMGINQTAAEKEQGFYRCSIMDARSTRSNENDYCIVLQDLKAGQMHLDSYWPGKNYMY